MRQSVFNSGRQAVVRIEQLDGSVREVRVTQKLVGKAPTECVLNGWCVCMCVCVFKLGR